MRYMMLIYSKEMADGLSPEEQTQIATSHAQVIAEATRKGIFLGAEPLAPTSLATTVRVQNGQPLVTDGPFAETKEQLAGYYMLDCANLDEAIEWAAKIPTACRGRAGSIEIRPMPGMPSRSARETVEEHAALTNG